MGAGRRGKQHEGEGHTHQPPESGVKRLAGWLWWGEGMSEAVLCVLPPRLRPQCPPPGLRGARPSHRGPGGRTFTGARAASWGPEKGEHCGAGGQPDPVETQLVHGHTHAYMHSHACTHRPQSRTPAHLHTHPIHHTPVPHAHAHRYTHVCTYVTRTTHYTALTSTHSHTPRPHAQQVPRTRVRNPRRVAGARAEPLLHRGPLHLLQEVCLRQSPQSTN